SILTELFLNDADPIRVHDAGAAMLWNYDRLSGLSMDMSLPAHFFDLTNQTALVTGGAMGIGAVIAKRLALAGATVAIADIDLEQAQRTAEEISSASNRTAIPVAMDVSNRELVESAVKLVLSQTGRLDILVNNAGIGGRAAPLWEQTDEDWSKIL